MGTTHDYLERCDRLAVMGGTFDPIHYGHLAVAEAVAYEFKPRRVLFIPGGQPPHKPDKPVSDGEHRYKMTLAAICENPSFDVSRTEISRTGPSYTVDTIEGLRKICPPQSEIYFIIGADALMDILSWHGAEKLLTLCEIIAVRRPGYEIDNEFVEYLRGVYSAVIHIFDGPRLEISSTEIRGRFASGLPVGGLMPHVSEDYAKRHGLFYSAETTLSDERFETVKNKLETILSIKRFKHTLGTVAEAEKLAAHYGADVNKARWAALLHDCAKEFSADKKRALCEIWGIPTDEIMLSHIDITHSLLGAESARRNYYVTDRDVLQAISRHTMGHKGMTLLDKIIMLADYIEPYRDDYPPLDEIRRHAYTDINKALITGMKYTNNDLKQRGNAVHQWSKDALEELQKQKGEAYGE